MRIVKLYIWKFDAITSTPYAVLPLSATWFAACTAGILGDFHRAISYLKWYKIVCMSNLACAFSWMKSFNMFSVFFAIWSSQTFPAVWIYNLTIFMFMYVNVDLKL